MFSNKDHHKKPRDGISLRKVQKGIIIGAVIISAMMLCSTYQLTSSFRSLTKASEQQIELRKAARELMDASDYLTEKVQRFTVIGDRHFLDEYFDEALENQRREEAIAIMSAEQGDSQAYEDLQKAMDESVKLMDREYYAMKLVASAKGYTDCPDAVENVVLSSEDQALDAEGKMKRAAEMVHDEEYYSGKDEIRKNMNESLNALEQMAYKTDADALDALRLELNMARVVIILQMIAIFIGVWLTSSLGINPVLNAVERIREDSPIPEEKGANEFRYLARTYNKIYDAYKSSLANLNFKVSHDDLTGAYNRSGYDLLLSSIDPNSTYMMLFDVDNFKSINDTYGHETGDKVLKKLVDSLKNNFRSDDYICRIGGDEFVVFMVHAKDDQKHLIASKIDQVNRELESTDDGLPPTSISVGIVHGSEVDDSRRLFEKTDEAMYRSKQDGKHTYTFYTKTRKESA